MISTFGAVFDANVLYSSRIRSLLMELTMSGLFRPYWSVDIHREWMEAVNTNAGIAIEKLETTRSHMDTAVPDACVTGYVGLIPALTLPDPDDRHVLAVAIRAGASAIVTFNEKHFPIEALEPYGLHTRHPDMFIRDVDGIDPGVVAEAARADLAHYQNPPLSVDEYIAGLEAAGLPQTAQHLRGVRVLLSGA
jgi:predicted nucleic acid-binding protein